MSLHVTLKLATSLDGRIATASGESQWITGEAARAQVHRMRAEHDVVLVGIGTVLADDPELTVRLPGYEGPQPARAVLDTQGRLPPTSKLAQTAGRVPTWLFTSAASHEEPTVRVVSGHGRPEPADVIVALAAAGLRRVLIEGGGQVAASFLRAGLVDALEWFRAPVILGQEGRPAIGAMRLERLTEAPRFSRVAVQPLGDDLWERYVRA